MARKEEMGKNIELWGSSGEEGGGSEMGEKE